MDLADGLTFGSKEEASSLANCVPRAWATGAGKTVPRLLGKPRGGCMSALLPSVEQCTKIATLRSAGSVQGPVYVP